MAAASELLKETKSSIGHIGSLVGYAEQAAFTNAFRRETGFSRALNRLHNNYSRYFTILKPNILKI